MGAFRYICVPDGFYRETEVCKLGTILIDQFRIDQNGGGELLEYLKNIDL